MAVYTDQTGFNGCEVDTRFIERLEDEKRKQTEDMDLHMAVDALLAYDDEPTNKNRLRCYGLSSARWCSTRASRLYSNTHIRIPWRRGGRR